MVGADVTVRPSFIIPQAYGEKQSVHGAVRFEVEGRGLFARNFQREACVRYGASSRISYGVSG